MRRMLMMGALVLLPEKLRAFVGLMLAFLFWGVHAQVSPYATPMLNTLATAAHTAILMVFAAGVVISAEMFDYADWALGLGLLGLCLLVVAIAVAQSVDLARRDERLLDAFHAAPNRKKSTVVTPTRERRPTHFIGSLHHSVNRETVRARQPPVVQSGPCSLAASAHRRASSSSTRPSSSACGKVRIVNTR